MPKDERGAGECVRTIDPLHRYLLERLRRPRRIDALASAVHERLNDCAFTTDQQLLDQLWSVASETMPACIHASGPDHATSAEFTDLQGALEFSLSRLPSLHATVLLAHKREGLSCDRVCARFDLPLHIAERYLSQALALLRTYALAPTDASRIDTAVITREEIFTAHDAADWCVRFLSNPMHPYEECLAWLSRSALHVRELLVAIAWDRLLDRHYATHF